MKSKQSSRLRASLLLSITAVLLPMSLPGDAQIIEGEPPCKTSVAPNPAARVFDYMAHGDRCFRQGNPAVAKQWYGLGKKPFAPLEESGTLGDPIYESEELSNKGRVFWKNYDQYKDQPTVSSGAFIPLYLLIKSDPSFVPGYLALAKLYDMAPEWCTQKAYAPICEGNPRTKSEVLELATAQFPNDPELTQAMVDAYVAEKKYLDASIAARQFSLFFPDYPGANEFTGLADKYLKRYRSELKTNSILSTVIGCGASVFVGGNTSGCGIGAMLIQGESRMGAGLAAATREQNKAQGRLVEDPEVTNYLKDIGDRLTPLMGRDDFEYEYHVIEDDSLNAFVFPGGKIFVHTGSILETNSEAELAGLLAHEISHAVFSHGYQRMADQSVGAGFSQVLPIGGLIDIALKGNSRRHEQQADLLGTKVLASAGYAADGLRNFMKTLSDSKKSSPPEWLSTHPTSSKRVRYLEELVLRSGYNQFSYEGVERHQAIQNRLREQL